MAKRKRKSNPPGSADAAFESFHGKPSEETVTVTQEVHYHKYLAAAGELRKLVVFARNGTVVNLTGFGKALLCVNEAGTQLFIRGGSQSVDLKAFGITTVHEHEDLGEVQRVWYFTKKDHLGDEGGEAIYDHKFSQPYPRLQYDVRNEQLSFSGGRYVISPEGIDK